MSLLFIFVDFLMHEDTIRLPNVLQLKKWGGGSRGCPHFTFSYGFDNKILFNCKLLDLIFTVSLIGGDVHPNIDK